MPSDLEREREHYRRMAENAAERNRPEKSLLSDPQLLALIGHLDTNVQECDHTQRQARGWLATQTIDNSIDEILLWLGRHGGGCDCEISANFCDQLEYLRPQPPRFKRKKKQKQEARSLVNAAGWQLDSLPTPWRIANMFVPQEPIQIKMGKKGGCSITIIDRPPPVESVTEDSFWGTAVQDNARLSSRP